ncbi:MAG: cytochrome [Planctomycetota bacterium]|nr:cytochrome [Planctomycetota bacterium]
MAIGLALSFVGLRTAADDPTRAPEPGAVQIESQFRDTVRPFLEANCLGCHGGDKPKGDLDLSAFTTAESAAKDFARWELVLEQLEARTMPPPKAKRQPTAEARQAVIAWIEAVRQREAGRNAGDPGAVPARRLSNAEYDHTVRDLTGVDLRPTREFPVDPANEAGFDNSAESLTMSPALVKKYLEAAREIADHLVLKPDGIAFATHPMLADTDRDKYCVRNIIDFYKRQKADFADYFFAAWRFRHRDALGRPESSLEAIASEAGLSPKYLAAIWAVVSDPPEKVGPIAALQAMWRELPAPDGATTEAARAACERMRDVVADLRRQLTPEVKNLPAKGISNGSQPLVLWKNRQYAANRMRYAGGAAKIRTASLKLGTAAETALAIPENPDDLKRFEATFDRFCRTFPDAFLVSERARVYLDPKQNQGNDGRLLSAGFHSMTGYFRDDGPLFELMLDEHGRRELDRLWREFDFITGAPMRQYASYLWFERAETSSLRGREFDFVRAEDKDAGSEAKIARLAEVYIAKVRRDGNEAPAIAAVEDQFRIIAASIRQVEQDRAAAEPRHVEAVQAFAARAYRRPLSNAERQGVADFYRTLRQKDGLGHEDAVRDTVVSVLMSPHFCYRADLPVGAGGPGIRPLSDYDLASRLSYFLWSSMPDEELLARAAAGDLHRPEVLAAQARRMLRDDRVRGLATEFGGNWLDFRRFEEHNSVDRGRFPTFDDELRRSMFEEPVRFFVDIARNDRPVHEFLDGKHTFINPALARHYRMPVPEGGPDAWVRIDDATGHGRGGLLPMAVFLTRNSPGLRTSPVKRGYWVVRRLLGEKIPAPPADVPDLPDDESKLGELTLREALARHRADKSCAGCHERFDAIGLAFEGYGPVGEARTTDLGGRPINARATFPRGGEGSGVEGLRAYLDASRRPEFEDNLRRKLLAYALGRTLIPSDDATIDAMRARHAADGGRFGGLVETIVTSPQFLNKRVEGEHAE